MVTTNLNCGFFSNSVKRIRRDFLAVSSSFIYTPRIRECVSNGHFGTRDSTVLKNVRQNSFAKILPYVFQNRKSLKKTQDMRACSEPTKKVRQNSFSRFLPYLFRNGDSLKSSHWSPEEFAEGQTINLQGESMVGQLEYCSSKPTKVF